MTKRTNHSNQDSSETDHFLGRRAYLRLTGAAGVTGVGMSALGGQVSAADHQPKRTLTIEATRSSANYQFSVNSGVTHSEAMGATVGGDDINGNDVDGHVAGTGRDSYAFTGKVNCHGKVL